MATLSTTKIYSNNNLLSASDLDAFIDDIESFFNTTKINDDNIATNGINGATKIAKTTLTTAKLANTTVLGSNIATGTLTNSKVLDANITTAKYQDEGLITDNFASDAITNAKMTTNTVTGAKFIDDKITFAKRVSKTAVISSSSGAWQAVNPVASQPTNLNTNITTIGNRPVLVGLVSSYTGASRFGYIGVSASGSSAAMDIEIIRDTSTTVCSRTLSLNTDAATVRLQVPPSFIWILDVPGPGTINYKVEVTGGSGTTAYINNCYLVAVQI